MVPIDSRSMRQTSMMKPNNFLWSFTNTRKNLPIFPLAARAANAMDTLRYNPIINMRLSIKNSILQTWNNEGAEISPNAEGIINYTDESGLTQPAYAEYKGRTCNLYVRPRNAPNHEKTIGVGATIDDIAQAMDLYPSMRDKLIFLAIGLLMGWQILAPMANKILS
jgi:hypothetical protein